MSRSPKNFFANVDVDTIIKNSITKQVKKVDTVPEGNVLSESYVHEPKQFKQVSEFVSQKTKNAHTDLYKNYVESLNKVSSELDTAKRGDANPRHSEFKSLKLDEVFNLNAVWLHELYFANCFDPHSEIVMDSIAFLRLQRDFGTFDDWQRDFMACAMSAGNGWAVLGYHMFLRKYVNFTIGSHSDHVPLGFFPIIVMDMWEHAYYKDYASDKHSYLVAQMRELNWTVIEERIKKAEGMSQVLK